MILGNVSVFCNGRIDNGIYFGANSGLIYLEVDYFTLWQKMDCFLNKLQVNKNQVPAKALWVQCLWMMFLQFQVNLEI
jgi:APA family basic amino acid/polyamine antiporter